MVVLCGSMRFYGGSMVVLCGVRWGGSVRCEVEVGVRCIGWGGSVLCDVGWVRAVDDGGVGALLLLMMPLSVLLPTPAVVAAMGVHR